MSDDLISRSDDLRRLEDEGFELSIRSGYLLVHSVPYVTGTTALARGKLICPLDLDGAGEKTVPPKSHVLYFTGDTPCNKDGSPLNAIINNSNKVTLADGLEATHYFSSKPEGTEKYDNYYDKIVAYEGHLGRAARSIDPTANARTGRKLAILDDCPFQFPDTASARYQIGTITGKLAFNKVAIIGLGGTGSYVLDLIAKTPIKEIHLFDDDQYFNHNAFRSPGTPEAGALKQFPYKVDYYAEVYSRLHRGIVPHRIRLNAESTAENLSGFDFAFVCIDKGAARREITTSLYGLKVPFTDTGIGVGREDDMLDGCVRTTFVADEDTWQQAAKLLPFSDQEIDDEYETEIQIADLNALNAVLAVLRWKRWAGFYRDHRGEHNSSYMVEGNSLNNRAESDETD